MARRGALSQGQFLSVWKFLLTGLCVLTVGAGANERGVLPVSGGYRDDIRGVVVMFARDDQLDSVLYTMKQLREAHDNQLSNGRFSKDWVFYSDRAVSDEFKVLTSNLTRPGTAYYERWTLASKGWNLPALAQHKRLRGYNWAWCITPGTEFHSKVDFDSFEAMRSAGMIYGSSTSGLLQVVQPESTDNDYSDTSDGGLPRGIREIQWRIEKGASGRDASLTMLDDPDQFSALSTDISASWLAFVYKMCNACWDFEIAWLDVFRNLEYLKIANYIRSSLKKNPPRDDATSTAQGSLTSESQTEQTGNAAVGHVDPGSACPEKAARSTRARSGVFYLLGNPDDDISASHERWMQMADDFDEKLQKAPGLRSGRTSLFYRETVYTTKGRRARAWLFKGQDKISTDLIVFEDDGRCARGLKSVYCEVSELPIDGLVDLDDEEDK